MNRKPAAFFDRDGVLNQDIGYLYKKEDFRWIDGAQKTIKYFNDRGFRVIVITNQSGVARGYYTEEAVKRLHTWMNEELAAGGARIDAFYYCPHHPEGKLEQYCRACRCRKPETGLIEQAMARWTIVKEKSFLVGDNDSDMECARRAGLTGYHFQGGNLYEFLRQARCIQ